MNAHSLKLRSVASVFFVQSGTADTLEVCWLGLMIPGDQDDVIVQELDVYLCNGILGATQVLGAQELLQTEHLERIITP